MDLAFSLQTIFGEITICPSHVVQEGPLLVLLKRS